MNTREYLTQEIHNREQAIARPGQDPALTQALQAELDALRAQLTKLDNPAGRYGVGKRGRGRVLNGETGGGIAGSLGSS